MQDVLLENKSMDLTFNNNLEKHKPIRQALHNMYTLIGYGGTDSDQSQFVDSKPIATKTAHVDLGMIRASGVERHLATFNECKSRRAPFYPESQERYYKTEVLEKIEAKLQSLRAGSSENPAATK